MLVLVDQRVTYPTMSGVVTAVGGECLRPLPLTNNPRNQMTLAVLQELLMALRANEVDGSTGWLALGIEQLGRDGAAEVEADWMVS